MGGAPSLPRDLDQISVWRERMNPVYLSANDHAFKLPAPVDYIVACDNIEPRLRPYGRPIVGPRHWADFRVLHQVVSNSGALACMVAWAMGCSPIVVCGVELYQGGTYFHDEHAKSMGKTATVKQHLRRWSMLVDAYAGAFVRPISGPLLQLFPAFDPAEDRRGEDAAAIIRTIVGGKVIEITRQVPDWHGHALHVGDCIEMRESEAGQAITAGYGKRYGGAHGHR